LTIRRYLAEPTLSGTVEVVDIIRADKLVLRLAETWFHVQGGGQQSDQGKIGSVDVIDVKPCAGGVVDHVVSSLDGIEVGQTYAFTIDEARRLLNTRLHSAGHLLAGVVESEFEGVKAAGGHHWPGEGRVDFELDPASAFDGSAAAIAEAVQRTIEGHLPITVEGDPFVNRICRIGSFRAIPCGGTHLPSTDAIGTFSVRSVKKKDGKLRIGCKRQPMAADGVSSLKFHGRSSSMRVTGWPQARRLSTEAM
jgi:alanyl-tRNA synthetase